MRQCQLQKIIFIIGIRVNCLKLLSVVSCLQGRSEVELNKARVCLKWRKKRNNELWATFERVLVLKMNLMFISDFISAKNEL